VIARLLLANALELGVGLGVVALCRMPIGAAYVAGIVVTGIVSAHLALVHVTFGWAALTVLAAISLGVAVWVRRPTPPRWRTPGLLGVAGVAALGALLARAWPTFASKPLDDYDAWAMWGMKAKALTELGWADPGLFASNGAAELHLDYPLLVPSLEAVAARAMGGFDPRLIHLQFLLIGVAGIAAIHGLLRERVPGWLLWPCVLALATAPGFSSQLLTAYADVPLALFCAAGLLAAARWIDDGAPRTLAFATLCLAGASLTKNEGVIFAAAAYLALLLATRRWRPLLLSGLAFEAALAPWQVWLRVHHVHSDTLLGAQMFSVHRPGIAPLALRGLLDYALAFSAWPLLLLLFLVAAVGAVGSRLAVFAWAWACISLLGLTWIYVVAKHEWSSYLAFSGDRVIDAVVVGAAALTPLLAAEGVSRIGRS